MANVKILGVDLIVLWEIEVFFGSSHSLCITVSVDLPNEPNGSSSFWLTAEKVLVDLLSISLWNKPA